MNAGNKLNNLLQKPSQMQILASVRREEKEKTESFLMRSLLTSEWRQCSYNGLYLALTSYKKVNT